MTAAPPPFARSFTDPPPIPEEGRARAAALLAAGRLHRYDPEGGGEAAALEREFAHWQGARFCLALSSGGQAMQVALRAAGVRPREPVLLNAWTLAPVPGAVTAVGAVPVLVDTGSDLRVDPEDLERRAALTGARVLLLSHMRGHLADMDAVTAVAARRGIAVIEDCAHSMGARWGGARSGSHGLAACFSTQGYKHLNSGEGGLLTTDDPALAARAVVLSGSYALHDRHGAAPGPEAFAGLVEALPNLSCRMDDLRAALLRPQVPLIDARAARWRRLHAAVARGLAASPAIRLPSRPAREEAAPSSFQFLLPGLGPEGCAAAVARAGALGVPLKWFGAPRPEGYTSAHGQWRTVPPRRLPGTDAALATLMDLRLPLTFTKGDCAHVADIVVHAAEAAPAPA